MPLWSYAIANRPAPVKPNFCFRHLPEGTPDCAVNDKGRYPAARMSGNLASELRSGQYARHRVAPASDLALAHLVRHRREKSVGYNSMLLQTDAAPATPPPSIPPARQHPAPSSRGQRTGRRDWRQCLRGAAWSNRKPPCRHRRRRTVFNMVAAPVLPHRNQKVAASGRRRTSRTACANSAGPLFRVQAENRAPRFGIPIGCAETGKGRHDIEPADRDRPFSASAPLSDACEMMPRPSRSHCTAAPAMKIEPSSA